jgi:preprotein translocase SecE subunit
MLFSYKPDEGRNARQIAFWFGEAVTAFGCMAFSGMLDRSAALRGPLFDGLQHVPVLGVVFSGSFVISLLTFLVLSAVWVRFLAKKKYSQHLIEVEAEINKVTWPSFKEASNSSFVVIGTVLVLMAFLALADWLLGEVFRVILWEA